MKVRAAAVYLSRTFVWGVKVIKIEDLDPKNPGSPNDWLDKVNEFDGGINGQDYQSDYDNVMQLSRLYDKAGDIANESRSAEVQGKIESIASNLADRSLNWRYDSEEEQSNIQEMLEKIASGNTVHCFAAGTLIDTPEGEVAVETLAIGDSILTASGETITIKWVGRNTVSNATAAPDRQPIRIRARALGEGKPHRDLVVTAGHGLVVDGLVINAAALVNGGSIDYMPWDELGELVTYYHIETEKHEVILANGIEAETYIDYVDRRAFDNYAEYVALYGIETRIVEMPSHRISARRMLPLVLRQRLGIDMSAFEAETA
ncbi:Hint domain-containing protein [Halomonas elongata]|uniref:Hint domain-containing protein n=1 Tax=Halomonas elongata TaxID=2746 RepID=UPI00186BA379|nr:Hint domain-containing protein [Halomonas elongata]MBW5801721.1 Hint domain-containing protein [Halomonas elongata]